ncbi:MAG: carboxymuconolactone decarboxylase family protein [Mariniphaga sp.]
MKTNYSEFHKETLSKIGKYGKANPELMGAFSKLHYVGSKPGALSTKDKELIALGISINTRCEGCIVMHTHDALKSGATSAEIVETIGTAIYMGGGPAVVYGVKAFEILNEFEEVKQNELIIKK